MKQIFIDQALSLEVGEAIEVSFRTYRESRAFQTGLINALGKVPAKLRATLLMSSFPPFHQENTTNQYIVRLAKIEAYQNAVVKLKDGRIMSLAEYDVLRRTGESLD